MTPLGTIAPVAWLRRRLVPLLVGASLLSTIAVVATAFVYSPLRVDGGWASYGGFALSQGREPYQHQGSPEEIGSVPGVKSLFLFDTVSNTRALYTSLWFRVVPPRWWSIRLLSLIEFGLLIAASALFFRALLPSHELAALATSLLMTDKVIVGMAAADFRPDLIQAALGCVLYLGLVRAPLSLGANAGMVMLAALFGMLSVTAVVPIALASIVAATELATRRRDGWTRGLWRICLVVAVSATAYVMRKPFFALLLGAERRPLEPVDTVGRVLGLWQGGPAAIFAKEAERFGVYFSPTNVPLLLGLLLAAVVWILPSESRAKRDPVIWVGFVVAIVFLVAIDPHPSHHHVVPAMPFALLLLAPVHWLRERSRELATIALAGVVLASASSGFVVAGMTAARAHATGFSNANLVATLDGLTEAGGEVVVAGGTEFWSYWDPSADVTIIDTARHPVDIDRLRPHRDRLQFALLSRDYAPHDWLPLLRRDVGIEYSVIVDKAPYFVLADLRSQRPDDSPERR